MSTRGLVVVLALLGALAHPALAQDRPVVFLHGLKSSPEAWRGVSERLQARLRLTPYRPSLDWRQAYSQQASALLGNSSLAGLPGHLTVAVGHSNGGIVARQWSRSRALSGIVTVGTPNAGAPLIANFTHWRQFMAATPVYVGAVMQAFARPSGTSWVMGPVDSMLQIALNYAVSSVVEVAAVVAMNEIAPVTADMRPGSAFLTSLNAPAALAQEAAAVPRRAGVVSIATNYYYAGPMRAALPDYADSVATALYGAIGGLNFWAGWVLVNAPQGDVDAIRQASSLYALAGHLASIDPIYCTMVSSPTLSSCVPNDGVVPHTSQRYPNALNVVMGENGTWGPVHTRLTEQSDEVLYRLLVETMLVPVRTASPPPGPTPPSPPPTPPSPPPSNPPQPGQSGSHVDSLLPGDILWPGDKIRSTDFRFELIYQRDGNLVLSYGAQALWHSGTYNTAPGRVMMQHDGHLVIYDAGGTPVWASGTAGHPNAWLLLQNDGNLVIYAAGGQPLWATNTSR